jgi:hypothetical protein
VVNEKIGGEYLEGLGRYEGGDSAAKNEKLSRCEGVKQGVIF